MADFFIMLVGVTCGLSKLFVFVRDYGRRVEGLSGPWILNEGRTND